MEVTIIGAGNWGTALAIILANNGHQVILVGRDQGTLEAIKNLRENPSYLPGFRIPENVTPLFIEDIPQNSECYIIAVPSQSVTKTLKYIPNKPVLVIIASKGFEHDSPYSLSQIVQERLPHALVSTFSGPNLAIEMVQGAPAASVIASKDIEIAEKTANIFRSPLLRIYTNEDVTGVELIGAHKNVLAIGGGISDGMGFGQNTKGVLMARGLFEITRLGLAMGAQMETFMGIAGVGDLFATAQSNLSRNYRVGYGLGQGKKLGDILQEIGQVAEGVPTSTLALKIAKEHNIYIPITEAIEAIITGRLQPKEAMGMLMSRKARQEMDMEINSLWEKHFPV